MGTWSTIWIVNYLLATSIISPVPCRIFLFNGAICVFMFILTRPRSDQDLFLSFDSEILSLGVITELERFIISPWSSVRIRLNFLSSCVILEVPRWITILD
jgi:hypothetical protein